MFPCSTPVCLDHGQPLQCVGSPHSFPAGSSLGGGGWRSLNTRRASRPPLCSACRRLCPGWQPGIAPPRGAGCRCRLSRCRGQLSRTGMSNAPATPFLPGPLLAVLIAGRPASCMRAMLLIRLRASALLTATPTRADLRAPNAGPFPLEINYDLRYRPTRSGSTTPA